jgi:PKD repeat protein
VAIGGTVSTAHEETTMTNPYAYTNPYPPAYPTQPATFPPTPTLPPPVAATPRGGLRLGMVVMVTCAIAVAAAASLPPTVATARTLAYPRPAVSIGVSTNATVHVNDQVQFTANVQAGRDLSFTWDFGDNATGTGAQATHTYTQYGNFTVQLSVRDPIGQQAGAQTSVSVLPTPPQACFASSADANDPLTINFDAACSTGAELQYSWDFGDGNSGSSGSTTSHRYSGLNTYKVTLTVVDVAGQRDSVSHSVTVSIPAPKAYFGVSQDPYSPYCYSFDGSGSSGYQAQLTWDFGDGYTDYGTQPYHCYYADGNYYVVLTVTDSFGRSAQYGQYVSVTYWP